MFEAIISTLKTAAKDDAFCTEISVPSDVLSLNVEPIGEIKFPISARTAKSLIVEADLAKFGKRDQTILDRSVRDVWEIPESRIRFGKDWDPQLRSMLRQVQKGLGLPADGTLAAQLHNLLIY